MVNDSESSVHSASPRTLERKLARAQEKVSILEKMIEDKTRSLFVAHEEQERMTRFLERILETMTSALIVVDASGRITRVNRELVRLTGLEAAACLASEIWTILAGPRFEDIAVRGLAAFDGEGELRAVDGTLIPVLFKGAPLQDESDELLGVVCIAVDLREKRQLEIELHHAQKLESVGQLAAGVAHEINTPIQFAGDSIYFLQEAFTDLRQIVDISSDLRAGAAAHAELAKNCELFDEASEEADLGFVLEEVPAALERAFEGIDRVATIVSAMKAFAHPGDSQKAPQNLNDAVRTTLEVCRNEYKYVADIDLQLGEIPLVTCQLGDINQVLLNLVVNAAHAIRDVVDARDGRGTITISTRRLDADVEIAVHDNGGGIPLAVQERIFDPFFTTKEAGVGTGQGLPISRKLIVDGHGGSIHFETQEGEGTTFFVRLPIEV